ncbi:MAG: magnesium-translocating P-type ATPase [Acidobacteria bacterium]|nr:magnesium-translocating P-type ATPase [Acidobacteriota bacterium]
MAGLSSEEAAVRLKEVGPNEPVRRKRIGTFREFLSLFSNPLVIILLVASSISLTFGNWINASIIISMVLIGVVLNYAQTARSRKVIESLRKTVSLSAAVMRDGTWQELPPQDLVPGDLIRLTAGDLVPADARLVECRDLHVQESALTGESLPVEKNASPTNRDKVDDNSSIFLGTSVISGTATAIVAATGETTRFGAIALRLADKPPETEFERGTRRFGFFIARVIFLLVIFVFFANALMQRDLLESLLFAIALAVGLTPEFLPMITTVTLGQGAMRMAKKKVIVKHLEAIQNFGSIGILCTDKTGTLTKGEMILTGHIDPYGKETELPFILGYVNSFFESGITNPLDIEIKRAHAANPLDDAILRHDITPIEAFTKLDEIPFDFERRRVSIVAGTDGRRMLITKGAPENVLEVCSDMRVDSRVLPISTQDLDNCRRTFERSSSEGQRVLAVAYSYVDDKEKYSTEDEIGLTLAGFLTFADEPKETAAAAVRTLNRDGVAVKLISGDNELVAKYVCKKVGIDTSSVITGDEVDRLDDTALAAVAEETSIFARVSPMQKNRIILALKQRGHVVGYMGDGINDAPSLRTADVGISVADATEVAKDAAEIVLMENSLRVLHDGIIEGRKSFGNVMKYLLMGTSSNFGNMFSMAAAVLFLPFLPMLPVQIILNNFLYDLAQITIPTDSVDSTFIRKPHRWDIGLIRDFMVYIGPISSIYDFLTFFVLLKIFQASEQLFHTGWFVESLATQTLVVFVIRTAGNPLKSRPSLALSLTVVSVVGVAVILPYTSAGALLGFVPLPVEFLGFVAVATVTYLAIVEVVKRKLMRRLLEQ